jgi:hypothetical protein
MNISPRTASLLLVTAVIAAACGGNVVVDGQPGNGTTSAGGAGGAPSTSAGGAGGAPSTGSIGGGGVSNVAVSTGGGFSVSASSVVGVTVTVSSSVSAVSVSVSSSVSSTGGGGGGSGPVGACSQGSDPMELDNPNLGNLLTQCAEENLTNLGALTMCIQSETGLSSGCVKCVGSYVECAIEHCIQVCIPPNDMSQACLACETAKCGSAFTACSGKPPPPT